MATFKNHGTNIFKTLKLLTSFFFTLIGSVLTVRGEVKYKVIVLL